MRRRRAIPFIAAVALLPAIVWGIGLWVARTDGFSAREEPRILERMMARTARRWAVPVAARNAANPIVFSPEVWADSRAHFADHCASCHANDGSGGTELGRNMFPRAPDMRLPDTQSLTDGEIYWVIANGIRLTGMPAWGPGGPDDADTWKLVHFVRRLKDLTAADLKMMRALNPRSPEEYEEERADQQFLAGEKPEAASPEAHHHD